MIRLRISEPQAKVVSLSSTVESLDTRGLSEGGISEKKMDTSPRSSRGVYTPVPSDSQLRRDIEVGEPEGIKGGEHDMSSRRAYDDIELPNDPAKYVFFHRLQ